MNELSPDLSYIEGDFRVYPNSFLFKAGSYPDKGIDVSTEDLAAAVKAFQPVNLNLEHATHGALQILNGKLGVARRAWLDSADPTIARGEVAVPIEIDKELAKRGISMELDRATKQFCGAALTYTPRVSEAALMSHLVLFAGQRHSSGDAADIQSAHDLMVKQGASCKADFAQHTWQGRSALQDIHDIAARSGGVCKANMSANRGHAEFMTQAEVSAMQRLHDAAVSGGAKCNVFDDKDDSSPLAYYSEQSRSTDPPGKGKEKKPMKTFMEELKALFTRQGIAIDEETPNEENPPRGGTGVKSETPTEKPVGFSVAEMAAKDAEIARLRGEKIHTEAVVFADQMIRENRALPAEKTTLIAAFTTAALDDLAHPTKVTFGEGKEGSRVDAFKARESARSPHTLTAEQLKPGEGQGIAFNETTPSGIEQARAEEARINTLLNTSTLGKAALKNGKGNH